MAKIKPTQFKTLGNPIQPTKVRVPTGISFSYRYYQPNHPKFSIEDKDSSYFEALLLRLRDLSQWTVQEFKNCRSKALRCHPIDWNDKRVTESSFSLPQEQQLVDCPYQWSLSANEHGRVHGFFYENIFYIVWLDPKHYLYAR